MFTSTTPTSFAAIPRPAFGRAAQHLPGSPAPLKGKVAARYHRAARTAAALLPELPRSGESVHALMTGTYDLCQVVTATVNRLPNCQHLRIATLCYSRRNAAELLALLEARKGLALTLLVSVFHREHNKELHAWLADELKDQPNARLAAARSHCKVVCFDLGPRDGLVFEGSANLRTNKNREQLTAVHDRTLHDWHAAWIDELVGADEGTPEGDSGSEPEGGGCSKAERRAT
jgi:hypothetical protein